MHRPALIARALVAAIAASPLTAFATTAVPLPEPEAWALFGIAAVAAAVITLRNRRK